MTQKACVILGSGLSLDGFDYGLLSGHNVIAVNDAGLLQYPKAQTLISTDRRWWLSVLRGERRLEQSRATRIICTESDCFAAVHSFDARLLYMMRHRRQGLSNDMNVLYGMYTTVHAAINLAVHEGARKIALLGVDLGTAEKRKYTYGGQTTLRTPFQFAAMKAALESCAPLLSRMNIKVINGSPDSALQCWRRTTPEKALLQC